VKFKPRSFNVSIQHQTVVLSNITMIWYLLCKYSLLICISSENAQIHHLRIYSTGYYCLLFTFIFSHNRTASSKPFLYRLFPIPSRFEVWIFNLSFEPSHCYIWEREQNPITHKLKVQRIILLTTVCECEIKIKNIGFCNTQSEQKHKKELTTSPCPEHQLGALCDVFVPYFEGQD
jgi:hypothetical protein